MRLVEPGEKATFQLRFRDNAGDLISVTTPTAKILDFSGTVIGLTTSGFTNVKTGVYDFELDTTDPDLSSNEGTYRLFVFGGLSGIRTFSDGAPELFELTSLTDQFEYASVPSVVEYLRLNVDQNLDIQFIKELVRAASRWVEKYCGRVFFRKTVTETHLLNSNREIFLINYPVLSLTSVSVATELVPDANYDTELRVGKITLDVAHTGEASVVYIHGSNTVPSDVELVTTKFAGFLFNRRMREGLASEHILGYTYTLIPDDILKELKDILNPHRIVRIF